jgi:hypothetical protein
VFYSLADPGSGAFLTPGSGVKIRIRDPGPGAQDEQPGSYFRELGNNFMDKNSFKFFDAHPGSGMEKIRIRDGKIWIRDVFPGSATLVVLQSTSVLRGTTFTKSLDLDQGILVNSYPDPCLLMTEN